MLSEYTKISEFNQYRKTQIKYINGFKNKFEKSSTTKVDVHFSLRVFSVYDMNIYGIENKHLYRGEVCMKRICESLREHVMKIINFEKKKMISLTNEKSATFAKERSNMNTRIYYNYRKVKNQCHYTGKYRACAI